MAEQAMLEGSSERSVRPGSWSRQAALGASQGRTAPAGGRARQAVPGGSRTGRSEPGDGRAQPRPAGGAAWVAVAAAAGGEPPEAWTAGTRLPDGGDAPGSQPRAEAGRARDARQEGAPAERPWRAHNRPILALIVDDEAPARAELRHRLAAYPDVEVVGEAADAREAGALLSALDYDVVFLDIQMPGVSGLDLARRLAEPPADGGEAGARPAVVFTTAYDEYAVEAFSARALHYLLKPIDEGRLAEVIRRLRELRAAPARPEGEAPASSEGRPEPEPLRWAIAFQNGNTLPVDVREVCFFSAEGDTVHLHTANDSLPTRYTLQNLEKQLPPGVFLRCHRSYLVNLAAVREIVPFYNGTFVLRIKDRGHTRIPVSRGRVAALRQMFGL
jgi:DNA-binding LytR/AlgR family response regulator